MGSSHLDKLFSDLFAYQQQSSNDLPPVHLWNPPLSGDIDIVIDREGRWFHEGDEIKRASLVKLFASILTCEGDEYFLVTPVEKWRIKVDVAPLFAISASRELRSWGSGHMPNNLEQGTLWWWIGIIRSLLTQNQSFQCSRFGLI